MAVDLQPVVTTLYPLREQPGWGELYLVLTVDCAGYYKAGGEQWTHNEAMQTLGRCDCDGSGRVPFFDSGLPYGWLSGVVGNALNTYLDSIDPDTQSLLWEIERTAEYFDDPATLAALEAAIAQEVAR